MKRVLEAITGAAQAGKDVQSSQRKADQASLQLLLRQFRQMKGGLESRLVSGVTDFRRFSLQALLADVDRLIKETEAAIQAAVATELKDAAERGQAAADQPVKAAGVLITPALPGLDADLVSASFGNTVDLLTLPMQQFAAEVKGGLRRVALAGDNKIEEIQKLRDKISGAGFDNAMYRAERIIRTEVGRVFNAAQYERMVTLQKTFPFLRKGWRSTKDSRTRLGHREAGQVYARGQGIPVDFLFTVNTYDERPGKGGKKTGTAALRFPLDPQTKPAGQIAAAATIMCRCNAFVDFSPQELSAYNRQQVSLALGGAKPPAPVPQVVPPPVIRPVPQPPAAPAPLPQPAKPKPVRVPRAAKPKPLAAVLPQPSAKPSGGGTALGTPISGKLVIPPGPGPMGPEHDDAGAKNKKLMGAYDYARKALALIDSVHGDGPLMDLPFMVKKGNFYGCYLTARYLALSPVGIASHALMTVAHEVGHYLDSMGLLKGGQAPVVQTAPRMVRVRVGRRMTWQIQNVQVVSTGATPPPAGAGRIGTLTTETRGVVSPELDALKKALADSQAYKDLQVSTRLVGTKTRMDLLSTKEVFARAYAQYITVKSGDPIMAAELREFLAHQKAGVQLNGRQWEEQDFKPIVAAFDALFEAQGWKVKG